MAALAAGLAVVALSVAAPAAMAGKKAQEKAIADFKSHTGMEDVEVPGADGLYLGKTYRGYQVLYTGKAGNVWGRYVARLAMGEIGREVGGMLAYLTGSQDWGPGVAGSPLDRALAEAIGQPLSVTLLLVHGKPQAPRLDIYPGSANIKPEQELPEIAKVGAGAGKIRSADRAFGERLAANQTLMKRLKKLRGQYLGVDGTAVALIWAGQETDFSAMIRNHGDYWKMIEAWLDDVADIADAIPGAASERASPSSAASE